MIRASIFPVVSLSWFASTVVVLVDRIFLSLEWGLKTGVAISFANGGSSSPLELSELIIRRFRGLAFGISNLDGALGRLELGSFCAITICLSGTFLDPFGLVGLRGDGGIVPLIGHMSTRLVLGGLESLE